MSASSSSPAAVEPSASFTPAVEAELAHKAKRSTFAALRHRNFRYYAMGMLVSAAGMWMQSVAQGWLVYDLSQSERTLGFVAFAAAIPALLISPWAGVLLDRISKRNVLLVTQMVAMSSAFIMAWLTFSGRIQVWHIVGLAVALGVVNAFDGPARQAFVVEMVGREDLTNAIAVNSMIFNGARVLGPAIGGILLAAVGPAWCFLFNGFSYLAVLAALTAMSLPRLVRKVRVDTPMTQLRAGIAYVIHRPDLATLLLQALIFSVFGSNYTTLLPAYASKSLGTDAGGYAALTAFMGIGALGSAFIMARWGDTLPRGKMLILAALIFPGLLTLFAWLTQPLAALVVSMFLGLLFLGQFVLLNTLIQSYVDDEMRGRVLSLYTLTFFGFAPLGNLLLGALAEQWSIAAAYTLVAAITLLLSAWNLLRSPVVRSLR